MKKIHLEVLPHLCYTCGRVRNNLEGRRKNEKRKKKQLFRQAWLCALGSRGVGGTGQYLAVPVPGGQIWRRTLPFDLYRAGAYLWLHDDHGRNGPGPHDRQKPGGRLRQLCQAGQARRVLRLRRLDQRHHPGADRTVLLGHRRLGHSVSGGVSRRPKPGAGGGRLLLRFHFQRCCNRDLLPGLCAVHAGHHLCGCAQRRRACLQSNDAGAGGAVGHYHCLLGHAAGSAGGRQVFPGAEPR